MTLPKPPASTVLIGSITGPMAMNLETRAYKDAIRAIARDIPNPEVYARLMPMSHAEALLGASPSSDGYRVQPGQARALRLVGLVECGENKRCLTAFGIKVRRALLEQDA